MRLPLASRPLALKTLIRSLPILGGLALLSACVPPPPPPDPVAVVAAPAFERAVELSINFDFDSYQIRPGDYGALDATAAALLDPRLAGYHFEINGHTDIIGRLGYNLVLSRLRAQAVASYLASRGVPPGLMRVQGFGPLQLLDPGNPASGVNRRVEIVALR